MIRALFLEYPNPYTLGKATQYQYLYGPYFLVAPIYKNTAADEEGNDIRDGIYLPEGTWIDYFTGEKYEGNRVVNNWEAPIWKLPVFVKAGAIIPMTNPNNHVSEINKHVRIYELYPAGRTSFTEYDDDGRTEAYRLGESTTTQIDMEENNGKVTVRIAPTTGNFTGFEKEKQTEFRVQVSEKPRKVTAQLGGRKIKLTEVTSPEAFGKSVNVFFYEASPEWNRFATPGSDFAKVSIHRNPQLRVKLETADITASATELMIEGYHFDMGNSYLHSQGSLTAPKAQVTDENREAYSVTPTWNKVENADYYEIEFNHMLYTSIKNTSLLFEGLEAETDYNFKIRSVNQEGTSDWASFAVKTKSNPLEFAIKGIRGESSAPSQEGFEVSRLFDWAETGDIWHSEYGKKAVPFDLIIDLRNYSQLDKFHYLPRLDSGNGTILRGEVAYSLDKEHWATVDSFVWKRNSDVKIFEFKDHPQARYIKLHVTEAAGNYGSGRELYVFKVPGTESYLPGDINNDGKIDDNDLTSYMNYTGLRKGDADFDYVSAGDINRNNLIDAYDISVVATQLEDGIEDPGQDKVSGQLAFSLDKTQAVQAGDTVRIRVKGVDLCAVNALSFALPYDQQDFQFIGVETTGMEEMENLTYDRLHTNGQKVLYPTFVNLGDKPVLSGSNDLFILTFQAKRKAKFSLVPTDGLLIDRNLNTQKF